MIDIVKHVNAIHREVGTGTYSAGEGTKIVLRRRYDAAVEDVWDACTDAERLSRWFLPVTGDLRLGGSYELKGNAHGEILRCEKPRLLRVSWIFGEGPASEVEVRLTPKGDEETDFELEHIAVVEPGFWDRYGPGATGVGWDLGLLGLGLHLAGGKIDDPDAWSLSDEGKDYATRSSQAWGEAYEKFGASPDTVASAVKHTTAFYTGQPED